MNRLPALAVAVVLLVGACTRNVGQAQPTVSPGVLPAVSVAVVDFPSEWLARTVGGDAVEIEEVDVAALQSTDTDLVAYVPGLDADVDTAVRSLPAERVVDLTAQVSKMASPRDADVRDPYVWFDPINVGTMAQTLGTAMGEVSQSPFQAYQYYGLRALDVQTQSLDVDQRLQELLNPCRIATLVVEAPVLAYLARAYALTQVPLIEYQPAREQVEALYFTLDAEAAVREAAATAGVEAVGVDTLTEGAPEDDLLQGILEVGETVAAHQDCPVVTPSATDRPG